MIRGETVVVERGAQTGTDAHGNPVAETEAEVVDNVLVAPGPRNDIDSTARPAGTVIAWTLHFPKPYAKSLRGARVSVRGEPARAVVGDPKPYTLENTPTDWWLPVEIVGADG